MHGSYYVEDGTLFSLRIVKKDLSIAKVQVIDRPSQWPTFEEQKGLAA